MKKFDAASITIVFSLLGLTAFVWYEILFFAPPAAGDYFLDVGQGDAELSVFPDGVKVLTDAGPDKAVLASIAKVLSPGDRYIDIGVISHPQLDHFNGFNYLLDNYNFGAFITNGRMDSPGVGEWPALLKKIESRRIPLITLAAGDKLLDKNGEIDFLSPDKELIQSGELNDTAFVELARFSAFRILLTSDIGSNVEKYLIAKGLALAADVLKVGHHGSKYSSSDEFLRAVNPKVAVIEVGAKNPYGHPRREALARLASSTIAKIFRTDRNGTVEVLADGQKLRVWTEK